MQIGGIRDRLRRLVGGKIQCFTELNSKLTKKGFQPLSSFNQVRKCWRRQVCCQSSPGVILGLFHNQPQMSKFTYDWINLSFKVYVSHDCCWSTQSRTQSEHDFWHASTHCRDQPVHRKFGQMDPFSTINAFILNPVSSLTTRAFNVWQHQTIADVGHLFFPWGIGRCPTWWRVLTEQGGMAHFSNKNICGTAHCSLQWCFMSDTRMPQLPNHPCHVERSMPDKVNVHGDGLRIVVDGAHFHDPKLWLRNLTKHTACLCKHCMSWIPERRA